MSNEILSRVMLRGLAEGKKLFWIFLYLWILLGLFSVHKSLVLNEQHLFYHQGFAVINAWLLAKVMLTAEMFHVADNLKHKPLIYPIVFKSAVFSMILVSFYILEEILLGLWRGKTIAESIPAVTGLWLFVAGLFFESETNIWYVVSGGWLTGLGGDRLWRDFVAPFLGFEE
jgi:hypothetical protein